METIEFSKLSGKLNIKEVKKKNNKKKKQTNKKKKKK